MKLFPRNRIPIVLCVFVLLATGLTRADDSEIEPPAVGRPENFSGAIGSFQLTMRAQPTQVQVEDPIVLTVRIVGTGDVQRLERPNLRRLPRFTQHFQIENLADRYLPSEKAREFDYRLRARSAEVHEIPPLPFVYFKPGVVPDYKGYQTTYTAAIPLTVRPRAELDPNEVQGTDSTTAAPASLYQWAAAGEVLQRTHHWMLPGPALLVSLVLLPPILSLAWWAVWRRLYPDAARLAQQRRSRAARRALAVLSSLHRIDADRKPLQAEVVVTDYLRRRFDLRVAEPTPSEIEAHLRQAGIPASLSRDVAGYVETCHAARFAPNVSTEAPDWSASGRRLILSLEADPCIV
jgi:BatD DUF11 like domain